MTYRNYLYKTYKTSAEKRNIEFCLTFDDFNMLISKNCEYCGSAPVLPTNQKYHKAKQFNNDPDASFNGIDRVDSNLDYTIDNCVPCCEYCKKVKLNKSTNEFLQHVSKIYKFNESSTTISKESTLQVNGNGKGTHPNMDEDIV